MNEIWSAKISSAQIVRYHFDFAPTAQNSQIFCFSETIAEHLEHVILLEKHKKQLEAEIKGHLSMQLRMKQAMGKIEKERDKMSDENKALTDRVEDLQEDIFQKNNYITEMKDNFAETQQKLFQVQQQFEIVRTERNLYERDLQACTEVREDLRERLRVSTSGEEEEDWQGSQ